MWSLRLNKGSGPVIVANQALVRSHDLGDIVLRDDGGARHQSPTAEVTSDVSAAGLEAGAATHLRGRVIDQRVGRAIAGAVLWVPESLDCHVRTDANGAFELALPPEVVLRRLAAGKAGFSVAFVEFPLDTDRQRLLLALEPASGIVRGVVVDARDRPIAGARIEARRPTAYPPVTHTDDAGRFHLEGLGEGRHRLQVAAAGFAASTPDAEAQHDREKAEDLRVVLNRPRLLTGRVMEEVGRALAGVRVQVERAGDPVLAAQTDEAGGFSVELLTSGSHVVTFEEEGYARVIRYLQVPESEGPVTMQDVVLTAAARVSGCVSDTNGKPLAAVQVHLKPLQQARRMDASGRPQGAPAAETAADGCFMLDALESGQGYDLELWRRGYLPAHRRVVLSAPERRLEFQMQPAVAVTVRILAEDGKPVAGATVALLYELDPALAQGSRRHAKTGEDGQFVFAAVPPGLARLQVLPDDTHAFHDQELTIEAGEQDQEVTVVVSEAAVLCGTVTDEAGRRITGAKVEVEGLLGGRVDSLRGLLVGGTDGSGEFCLYWLPPGPNTIVASHRDFHPERRTLTLLPGEQRQRIELRRLDRFAISGTLVEENAAAAGARVILWRDGRDQETTTDSTGFFVFSDLPEGDYVLDAAGDLVVRPTSRRLRVDRDLHGLSFDVRRACAIRGQLLGLSREDREQVSLLAKAEGSVQHGIVDPQEGEFSFVRLYPGAWRIEARVANTGQSASALVNCAPGSEIVDFGLAFDRSVLLDSRK